MTKKKLFLSYADNARQHLPIRTCKQREKERGLIALLAGNSPQHPDVFLDYLRHRDWLF